MSKTITASELKRQVTEKRPNFPFFSRKTMAFFGDYMANYKVEDSGDNWKLVRKAPVKCGLSAPCYFDKITLKVVYID
jgi:hypothetical protein